VTGTKATRTAAGPQTIAFFVRALEGGGAQRDAILLANEIAARGHSVKLLTLFADGPLRALVGEHVDIVPLRGRHLRSAVPALRRAIAESRPDVLVSAEAASNLVALVATRIMRREERPRLVLREAASPSVAERHDPYWSNRLAYRVLRLGYRLADVVVTLTDGAAADLAENFGVPRNKLAVLRSNAVIDASAVNSINSNSEDDREPGLIVSVGRLSPEKDHANLIRAFAKLDPKLAKRLEIAGVGPLRPRLEAMIAELGLGERVALLGFVADPFSIFRRAQLAVFSSLYEGFGNALVEALACGTPVVSTDCPFGPREILAGGRYGLLVEVGNPDVLAGAIAQALASQPDRTALRSRAATHTTARAADAFLAILAETEIRSPS